MDLHERRGRQIRVVRFGFDRVENDLVLGERQEFEDLELVVFRDLE